ncbi:MAG: hypothetical protein C0467_11275 [Planctomycetaceae bacterium]|nr:hypothetical protein [Planctomycetaceae bacterium]
MPTTHFSQYLPAVCAGLGLFLAGGANLLLLRRGLGVKVIATVLALGAATALAASLDYPGIVPDMLRIVAVGLVPLLFMGSRRFVVATSTFLHTVHSPAVRYGLVTVAGIGIAIGSVILFDRADKKSTEDSMAEMLIYGEASPSVPVDSTRARAATDRGTTVVLKEPSVIREDARIASGEERFLASAHLTDQVIRKGQGGDQSNCHGWVFADGKFRLSPDDVQLILDDNGYRAVFKPRPGDVIVYRTNGTITHSGVVRYVTEGQPVLVEGKWGALGIFLHPVDKSAYGTDYSYYRSSRPGHLLAGLQKTTTPGEAYSMQGE